MAKKDTQKLYNSFVNSTGKIAKQWGLGEPSGRVWATLLFSENPLSQKQIAEKTGYSLSLVSPSLKILEGINMVRQKRGKGKEKVYELTASFVESFHLMITRFVKREFKPLIELLEDHVKIDKSNKQLIQLTKEYKQLEMHLEWFGKIASLKKITKENVKNLIG